MNFRDLAAEAENVVGRTLHALPDSLRALAIQLPVLYQDYPQAEILGDEFEADILGLFVGEPYGCANGDSVPSQIFLFLDNIYDEAAGDLVTYRKEVRLTYLHELGHYLGWDEEEVEARGL